VSDGARITLFRDRVACVGMTQSGKSTFARHLFEQARCRRLLVDPKHIWKVKGLPAIREVADVDWRAPLIHFQPRFQDRDQANELYRAAFTRLRHALVWTDEAYGVSTSSWSGSAIDAVQTQGAALEIGHLVCAQRPVNASRVLWTEADHVFLFPHLDDEDLKTARQGCPFAPLELIRGLFEKLPRHGYVWLDRRQGRVAVGDPLPAALAAPKLVFPR
jgi:hypothetical protein